jgi:hypothetical protein
MSQQQDREPGIPHAPYPPQFQGKPKSSFSSSPHYSSSPNASRKGDASSGPVSSASLRAESNYSEAGNDNLNAGISSYSEKAKVDRPIPSRIRIYPNSRDAIACINCIPTKLWENATLSDLHQPEGMKNRKAPVLLELRQLELIDQDSEDSGDFFTTRTIGFSRGNPSLGTSVASTCLDLPVAKPSSSQSRMTAATGISTGALCIHTFRGDTFDEDGLLSSSIEYFHTPRRQATATSVAWRSTQLNHVAVGLLSSASTQPQGPGQRRGGGSLRTSGGDRDWGCLVWDIEKQQSTAKQRSSTPLSKLSHNSPVASLAWMMDGRTLAVGGSARTVGGQSTVQLYDMRVSGTNAPPISAHAHNFGVHGIEVDPFRYACVNMFIHLLQKPVAHYFYFLLQAKSNGDILQSCRRTSKAMGYKENGCRPW